VTKRHFGLPPDAEIDAGTAPAAIAPTDWEQVERKMAEAQRPGSGLFAAEYRTTGLEDGVERWISARGKVLFDSGGSPIRFLGITQDMTERRRLEETLRQREQEVSTVLDDTPDAILRFDRQLRFRYVNATAVRISGTAREDFIGKTFQELSRPQELIDLWTPLLRRVFDKGESGRVEFSYPSTNGQTEWEHRVVPQFAPDGSVESVLVIGVDITERRRLEALARSKAAEATEREHLIATLFDTAAQAILGVDAAGNIQLVNRMAEEVFGYQRDELLGHRLEMLVPQALRQKHVALRQSYMSTPKKRPMGVGIELQACRQDGFVFPIEVSLSHAETRRGTMAVAFLTDITVRKQDELALRRSEEDIRKASAALITAEEDAARQIARELHDDITQRLALLSMEIGKTAATPQEPARLLEQLRSWQAKILNISKGVRQISPRCIPRFSTTSV